MVLIQINNKETKDNEKALQLINPRTRKFVTFLVTIKVQGDIQTIMLLHEAVGISQEA
jgi:hypothetical protein